MRERASAMNIVSQWDSVPRDRSVDADGAAARYYAESVRPSPQGIEQGVRLGVPLSVEQ